MSHPFGDRLSQHLHRKHGLSQSKLAAGILHAPAIITDMCKGRRLSGPQVRERVIAIIHWLYQQEALATQEEANALLAAAGLSPLYAGSHDEAILLQHLQVRPDERLTKQLPLMPGTERVVPHHNLPLPLTPFIGRETEQRQIAALLADPHCRLLTLVGPGGVGKTRLALEVASTLLERYQHGVYFVALAPLSEPETMVPAIAASVGYIFQNDGRSLKQQLLDHVRGKELLLILDNAEHLPAGVTIFTEMLQAAPRVRLLVTSREWLRLSSETIFGVDGLAIADTLHDEGSAAVRLFLQIAQRVRPSFTPSAADLPAIVQVCRLVRGMPLGLILAATWIEMLTPVEIVTEINHSFDFLAVDLHDLPERHRSLQAIFSTSWQRLAADERETVQRLAVFRGGFTRKTAAIVAGAPLSILSTLSHKSFIQVQPNGRYEMHELLRQFALDTLGEHMAEMHDAHSAYYCAFLAQRTVDLKGARQQAAMAEIEADGENVRTAWQWAINDAQIDRLTQALDSLCLFYLWESRLREGEAMCRLAVERLALTISASKLSIDNCGIQTTPYPPDRARFGIRVFIWLSIFQRHLKQLDLAQQALRQAQAWLVHPSLAGLDIRSEQAQVLLEEAEVIYVINHEEARALVEQSLTIFRTLTEPWHMAQGLDRLGVALFSTGLLARARQVTEEGLGLRQALGDARGIAQSLMTLSAIARSAGSFEEAAELIRQSSAICRELNDQEQQAYVATNMAVSLVHDGQFAASLELFEEGLSIYNMLDLPGEPGILTAVKGFALMHLGRYEAARNHLQRAFLLYDKSEIGYAVKNLGRTALAEGNYDEAQQHLQGALALFRNNGDMNGVGQALGCLGYLALRQHNLHQAQAYIYRNLQHAVDTHLFLPSMTALAGVALLRAEQGDAEAAIELYTVALQNEHVANSCWYQDVVGQYIDAIAQTLPAEIVKAGKARGRARKWRSTVQDLLTTWNITIQRATA
jgi:predicted ATPase